MINNIIEMFSYTFILRAIIVGVLVSLCASLLGVSLVLKRYSMIGDGLSHVGFCTLAIATVLNLSPLMVSIPITIIVAFLLLRLNESSKIKGDSAIAMISSGAMAFGILLISTTTGVNSDVSNYLFGSILAMSNIDLYISVISSIIVIIIYILFYNKIFAVTFDESFAKGIGIKANTYNGIIAALTAITIVIGMRIVGSLLMSSLIIFPTITAMIISKKFKSVTITAAIISVITFFIGIYISYSYNFPTGASIVLINIIVYFFFNLIYKLKR